ncbi:MAG: hypothetical protein AABX11_00065 [Nanoarchaeota archaeon]
MKRNKKQTSLKENRGINLKSSKNIIVVGIGFVVIAVFLYFLFFNNSIKFSPNCSTIEFCGDGKDNNCNGLIDCADSSCNSKMGGYILNVIGGKTMRVPLVCCNGNKTDMLFDSNNCGTCGNSCDFMSCRMGKCSGMLILPPKGELSLVDGLNVPIDSQYDLMFKYYVNKTGNSSISFESRDLDEHNQSQGIFKGAGYLELNNPLNLGVNHTFVFYRKSDIASRFGQGFFGGEKGKFEGIGQVYIEDYALGIGVYAYNFSKISSFTPLYSLWLNDGVWHEYVITNLNGRVTAWVDGNKRWIGTLSLASNVVFPLRYVGKSYCSGCSAFDYSLGTELYSFSDLRDVRVYNRTLNDSIIKTNLSEVAGSADLRYLFDSEDSQSLVKNNGVLGSAYDAVPRVNESLASSVSGAWVWSFNMN